jgi:hypothetical protein
VQGALQRFWIAREWVLLWALLVGHDLLHGQVDGAFYPVSDQMQFRMLQNYIPYFHRFPFTSFLKSAHRQLYRINGLGEQAKRPPTNWQNESKQRQQIPIGTDLLTVRREELGLVGAAAALVQAASETLVRSNFAGI